MYVNQGGSSITLIVGKPVTLSATNVCVGDVPLVDWIRRLGSPVSAAVVSRRGVRITDWAPRIPVHDPGSPHPGSRHTSTSSVCLLSPSTHPPPRWWLIPPSYVITVTWSAWGGAPVTWRVGHCAALLVINTATSGLNPKHTLVQRCDNVCDVVPALNQRVRSNSSWYFYIIFSGDIVCYEIK